MTNVAALDCGSNSTRLLITDAQGRALAREMHITRLSEGVAASGVLSAAACERTWSVLETYRRRMDEYAVERGLLVATSAVRDATNAVDFLARASELAGVEARCISGDEEALLSYLGANASLPASPLVTVTLDIGGGSSELALRRDGVTLGVSMQLGCVRLTERALGVDVVTPAAAVAATDMIERELDRAFAAVPAFDDVVGNVRLVGLAGTVATLAQLVHGLSTYERASVHHVLLTRAHVQQWRDHLAQCTSVERGFLPGMVAGREDVMVAGLFILDAVMERFAVDTVLTSEDDILDGVAMMLRGDDQNATVA